MKSGFEVSDLVGDEFDQDLRFDPNFIERSAQPRPKAVAEFMFLCHGFQVVEALLCSVVSTLKTAVDYTHPAIRSSISANFSNNPCVIFQSSCVA